MGFPVTLAALGHAAFVPMTIATIVTVCVVFALAIVLVEAERQDHRSVYRFLPGLGLKLVRNPVLVSPVLVALMHLGVPPPAQAFLKMLEGGLTLCARLPWPVSGRQHPS